MDNLKLLRDIIAEIDGLSIDDSDITPDLLLEYNRELYLFQLIIFEKSKKIIQLSDTPNRELTKYFLDNLGLYDSDIWDDLDTLIKLMDFEQDRTTPYIGTAKNVYELVAEKYIDFLELIVDENEYGLGFYNYLFKRYLERIIYFSKCSYIQGQSAHLLFKINQIKENLAETLAQKAIHIIEYDSVGYYLGDFKNWLEEAEEIYPEATSVLKLKIIVKNLELAELEDELYEASDEIDENYRPIYCIAKDIAVDWGDKVNYAAKPYLDAMLETEANQEKYGEDSMNEIISYFLANSETYNTENARIYKKELKNFQRILDR